MSARARLLALLTELSYERRPVVLASGAESDFYIDCRQTALHPEGAACIGELMLEAIEALESELGLQAGGAGGMTLGADPLATAVSLAAHGRGRHLPAYIVRKKPKGHGTQRYVEGRKNLPDGTRVVLLEDVVTTGGSTLKAAEHLRNEGLDPIGAIVIVDRQEGGLEALTAGGLPARALYRRADFG